MDDLGPVDIPPYRPPSEAHSVLVRVTRGCAWNRCAFCGMYKGMRFEARPRAEVEADIARLAAERPDARSIFLADSDALVHPEIVPLVAAVRRAFSGAERITSYTRLHTLSRRPLRRWLELREAGLTRLHVGLESGDDGILARVHKGATAQGAIEAGRKALAARFDLCFYVLSGLGGESDWEAHAAGTARVIAAVAPRFVRLRSLVILPRTPLHEELQAGSFTPAPPRTRLRETALLIAETVRRIGERPAPGASALPLPAGPRAEAGARARADAAAAAAGAGAEAGSEIEIASDHFSNYIWADGRLVYGGVNGFLPGDAPLLLETLAEALRAVSACRAVQDPAGLARSGRGASLYSAL